MVRIASGEHLRKPLFLTEGGSESEHSIQENSVSWRYQYGVVMGPRGPHCLLYPQWYQISLGIKETNKSAVLVLGIWSGWKKNGCCRGSGAVNPKIRNNRVGALTGALWVKGIRTSELSMCGSLVQSLARAGVRWEDGGGARPLFSVSLSHHGFESMAPWWLERKGS